MIVSLIREIVDLFGQHLEIQMDRLAAQAWKVVFFLGVLLISIVMIFLGLVFFGVSLYRSMSIALGPDLTPLVAGCFFLLFGLIILIISKKFINRR